MLPLSSHFSCGRGAGAANGPTRQKGGELRIWREAVCLKGFGGKQSPPQEVSTRAMTLEQGEMEMCT